MTFDPMSVEVTCVTLPKDHCVQVPWQYINVCGYSDQFCKIPHTPLLVKRVNWGYLYTPIQTGTFECGYTPAYWGYTKYECDYTPITWGYPNTPSIGDMLLNAFIWHFRSHAGNAQMGTSPVGSVSTFPLAESDVCPRFTPFTNAPPYIHTHTYYVQNEWSHSLLLNSVQARQKEKNWCSLVMHKYAWKTQSYTPTHSPTCTPRQTYPRTYPTPPPHTHTLKEVLKAKWSCSVWD